MTIYECYQKLGGNADDVLKRFTDTNLINKFLKKFLDDPTFDKLSAAMENGQRKEAFCAAHTLKGISQNMGLGKLIVSSQSLTEALRDESEQISELAYKQFENTRRDYEETVYIISEYLNIQS